MRQLFGLVLVLAAVTFMPSQAQAHALQPGYLELQAYGSDTWRVIWRVPDVNGRPMGIQAQLPKTCDEPVPPRPIFDGAAWLASWMVQCPGGLAGNPIMINGLSRTNTDVLVRLELSQGQGQTQRLTPDNIEFIVPTEPDTWQVFQGYLGLGTSHILEGYDHLLFVFALLLLIQNSWRLAGAITSFTVAHSITLAASTLGWVTISGPPVEAFIALSIVFLASELAQRDPGTPRLSERFPWVVAFAFGLLHGFGFAGALSEIGLPQNDIPMALFSFNLGVEVGQLLFVAAIFIVWALVKRVQPAALAALLQPGRPGNVAMTYSIGGMAAYWFIDRIAGF